jgi:hypothetical protein
MRPSSQLKKKKERCGREWRRSQFKKKKERVKPVKKKKGTMWERVV